MYNGNVFGALFNKLIRKAIIDQTQVTFRYNLSFCVTILFSALTRMFPKPTFAP